MHRPNHNYTADTQISFFMKTAASGRRKEGPLGETIRRSATEIQAMSEKDIKTLLAAVFQAWVDRWSEWSFGEVRKFRHSPTGRDRLEDSELILSDSFKLTVQRKTREV